MRPFVRVHTNGVILTCHMWIKDDDQVSVQGCIYNMRKMKIEMEMVQVRN